MYKVIKTKADDTMQANDQFMICSKGDVICMSDPQITDLTGLETKFNIMCEALNKAEPTGAITTASELEVGVTYWNSYGFRGAHEPTPITVLSTPYDYTAEGDRINGKFVRISGYVGGELSLHDRAIDYHGHNTNRLFRTKEEAFKHWGSFQ